MLYILLTHTCVHTKPMLKQTILLLPEFIPTKPSSIMTDSLEKYLVEDLTDNRPSICVTRSVCDSQCE